MLLSACWINDAGILPGFSMPGLIWRMNASRTKHNENMQLRPSFVSHKLWNFPEARELDTNRADCLSGQIGCTRMTEPPTVCLQVTAGELYRTPETFASIKRLPSTFLIWCLPPRQDGVLYCGLGYVAVYLPLTCWLGHQELSSATGKTETVKKNIF